MTIRELQPSEFYRLNDHAWLKAEHRPIPGVTRVVVGEDDNGEIQGFAFVQYVPHIEPVWVSEKHRSGTLFKRIYERASWLLSGKGTFLTMATTEQHGNYLERLGLQRRSSWISFEGRM